MTSIYLEWRWKLQSYEWLWTKGWLWTNHKNISFDDCSLSQYDYQTIFQYNGNSNSAFQWVGMDNERIHCKDIFMSSFVMHVEMDVSKSVKLLSPHPHAQILRNLELCVILIRNSFSFHFWHCKLGSYYCLSVIASKSPQCLMTLWGDFEQLFEVTVVTTGSKMALHQQLICNLESNKFAHWCSLMQRCFLVTNHVLNWSLLFLSCKHSIMRDDFEHVQSHPVEHVQSHPDNRFWKCHSHKNTMF